MTWLVTYGTRLDLIDADTADDARIDWIERHRPDWWDGTMARIGGRTFDPYRDLHVRAATTSDLARVAEMRAEVDRYAPTPRHWR